MIQLNQTEIAALIRANKNKKLAKTRNHYYMCNDDYSAMKIVAEMRGYDVNDFYRCCVEGLNYK